MVAEERRLTISGLKEWVSVACEFVADAARRAGLDERAVHHCQLAVDEACTNVIEHGYRSEAAGQSIEIVCRLEGDRFAMTVIDDGPAFDPLAQADPDPSVPVEEREPGGWGIYFIKKVMDEVIYTYDLGRNSLRMVKLVGDTAQVGPKAHGAMRVSVSNPHNGVWVFAPHGRLDAELCPGLERMITERLEQGIRYLVLDMGDVDYVSSMGLKMLVSLWQRARERKGDLMLAAVRARVHEVLQIIGLDLVFGIFTTPGEAAAALDR